MAEKKKRKNMFEDYVAKVTGSRPRGLSAAPSSVNAFDRFNLDSAFLKEWYGGRPDSPGIGDVAMYDLTQKQYPRYVQSQKKARKKHEKAPTGRERTKATLAKVKPLPADIKKRKGGGQVSPDEAYVASFYKELK